jgi:hypothetical protein
MHPPTWWYLLMGFCYLMCKSESKQMSICQTCVNLQTPFERGPFLSVPLIGPKSLALPLKSSAPKKKSRLIYEINFMTTQGLVTTNNI